MGHTRSLDSRSYISKSAAKIPLRIPPKATGVCRALG